MVNHEYLDGSGRLEARYLAFLETVSALRRACTATVRA